MAGDDVDRCAGFLYVCMQPGASFYKMGQTRNPEATVKRYKTTLGLLSLKFFACGDDPKAAEASLFLHMAAFRVSPAEVFARYLPRDARINPPPSEREALRYLVDAYGAPARAVVIDSPKLTQTVVWDDGASDSEPHQEPHQDERGCCGCFKALRGAGRPGGAAVAPADLR